MDFESGIGQKTSLKPQCHGCVPYSSPGSCLQKPDFCRKCGCLLQRSSTVNGQLERFVCSQTFSSEEWGVSPQLLLLEMFNKETKIIIKPTPPDHFSNRAQLIQFLEAICRQNDLKISTFVLSLRLLDEVCAEINFKREELTLIAIQVLAMTSKMEEHPNALPLSILIKLFAQKFSVQQIIDAEKILFKILKFRLRRETILDFLYFFLSRGIVSASEIAGLSLLCQQEVIQSFENWALRSAVEVAKKFEANLIAPSKVAAAVVWASRKSHGFVGWPPALALLVRASESELESIYLNLVRESNWTSCAFDLPLFFQPIPGCHTSRSIPATIDSHILLRPNSTQPSLGSNELDFKSGIRTCNFFFQSSFEDNMSKDSIRCQELCSNANIFLARIQNSN